MRLALAISIVTAAPAFAEPMCANLAEAIAGMKAKYGEDVRLDAMTSDGRLLIITASPEGGWTAMLATPDGNACIVADGHDLEFHAPEAPGVDG